MIACTVKTEVEYDTGTYLSHFNTSYNSDFYNTELELDMALRPIDTCFQATFQMLPLDTGSAGCIVVR
jgi:hypothetical protein